MLTIKPKHRTLNRGRTGRQCDPHTRQCADGDDARVETRPYPAYRGAVEIARFDGDALISNLVTAGRLYVEQDGRAVVLAPGGGAISDAARAYSRRFDDPLGCVGVKIPKSALSPPSRV